MRGERPTSTRGARRIANCASTGRAASRGRCVLCEICRESGRLALSRGDRTESKIFRSRYCNYSPSSFSSSSSFTSPTLIIFYFFVFYFFVFYFLVFHFSVSFIASTRPSSTSSSPFSSSCSFFSSTINRLTYRTRATLRLLFDLQWIVVEGESLISKLK